MAGIKRMTLAEARKIAREHDAANAEYQRQLEETACENHYRDRTPSELIRMWETGSNEHGKPLSEYEFKALCAAWYLTLGGLPQSNDDTNANSPVETSNELPPEDSIMLDMHEVVRITGLSQSTIKRMVIDHCFPQPLKLSPRRNGWPMKEVRQWLETLHDQRGNGKRTH
jgi:predicted DNA-binding transcriptional regulator AlpA